MQKGTVLNLRKFNSVIVYLKANWCLISLSVILLIGVAFGVIGANSDGKVSELAISFTEFFLKTRTTGDFVSIFISSLSVSFTFLLLIFIFGTSVTGITLVPILTGLRGTVFGVIVSYVYGKFSFKGIAFNALILIPPTIISVIFLIIAAKEGIKFSLKIIDLTLPESMPKNLSHTFKLYCKRYLLLAIPIIFSALLDAWLSVKFISIFNL